jgi:RHS repeat-associated protein
MADDDRRCLVPNLATGITTMATGRECDAPGAVPLPTTDDPPAAQPPAASPEELSAPTPPPQTDAPPYQPPTPTANGTSHVTPGGGPTAQPADRPPPSSDRVDPTTPLQQQYLRPLGPIPDYGILDALRLQATPASLLDERLRSILRNDPPPGQPHPTLALNNSIRPTTIADPIDPFTGQLIISVTDVLIPSRGMDLQITRTYRSGVVSFGPWGFGWDHSYNVYLRELDAGAVAIRTGALHEDVYRPDGTGGFIPPIGILRLLERSATPGVYVLSDREGIRFEFERPAGWPSPERVPLARIVDRHDNVHTLSYDADGRVIEVADGLGRRIELHYGSCDLLEEVSDHAGRVWRYTHDDDVEHLVAVTTPPISEHPDGLTTRYEYDRDAPHPALRHNITTIRDGAGAVHCENEYGDDPLSTDFTRLVYQRWGNFEASFTATELQIVPREAPFVNAPTLRVEMVDPGHYYVHTYNFRGDLLEQRFRLIADGTGRLCVRSFLYDDQGNLTQRWEADGGGTLYSYDSAHADPRARANLLKTERIAPPAFVAPSRITALRTYDVAGLRLKTARNAGGRTTTFIHDADTDPFGKGDLVEVRHPAATLPNGTLQSRTEKFAYDSHGLLVEHVTGEGARHVFEYAAAGPDAGYLRRVTFDDDGVALSQSFEYDVYGHRSAQVDGLGRRVEQSVNAIGLVESRRVPGASGVDEIRFFYDRAARVRREEWPRGSYDDGGLADSFIANEYDYDVLGHVARARFGVNASRPTEYAFSADEEQRILLAIDPLGRVTRQRFDERGLLLERREAFGTPDEAVWRTSYGRDGRRRAAVDPAGHAFAFRYDAWGRLVETRLPGAPEADRTRVALAYDHLDLVTAVTVTGSLGDGTTDVLSQLMIDRDERGRPYRHRTDGRELVTLYDAEDRPVRRTDSRGSAVMVSYDGVDRIARAEDAAGNVFERTFDAAGQLIETRSSEPQADGSRRSYKSTFVYDAAGRPVRHTDPLGRQTTHAYDARGLPVLVTDPLGRSIRTRFDLQQLPVEVARLDAAGGELAVHGYGRDAVGRLLSYTDPLGHTTRWDYDTRDRCTAVTYPDGRVHRYGYGVLQQMASETRPDGTELAYSYGPDGGLSRLEVTPGAGLAPVGDLEVGYDGLRRVTQLRQGGAVLERQYDASSRVTLERLDGKETRLDVDDAAGLARFHFPDGRVDRLELDALARMARRVLETPGALAATGALAAGAELARYSYDGADQPAERVLGGAVTTSYGYDAGGRLVAIDHRASGTSLSSTRYAHDRVDRRRLVWAAPDPQAAVRNDFDDLDHLTAAGRVVVPKPVALATQADADGVIAAAAAAPPSAAQTFNVDPDDSRTGATRPGSADAFTLDSCHRVGTLVRTGAGAGTWPFAYDGDGRLTRDDRHEYRYDAHGRLVEVRDTASGATVLTLAYDPAGRVSETTAAGVIEHHHHHGSLRIETERAGAPTIQFTHGARSDELLLASDGSNRILLSDLKESVVVATDESGAVLERYAYDPFGRPSIFAPDGATPRAGSSIGLVPRFATYPLLASGLYDARARVYDPASGRFLQADPLLFASSADPYAYVGGDPVDLVDPSGEAGILIALAVAAVIGAVAGGAINAAHQYVAIQEGAQKEWEWGQFGWSVLGGAVVAPILVLAPELAVPLAAMGVAGGIGEISEGHPWTGAFDIAASILPFAGKGVRSATFGPGTIWGPGPTQGLGGRFGRFQWLPSSKAPGVRVTETTFPRDGTPVPAWEKSVGTRLPVLEQWSEATIRAQQEGLENLSGQGVESARVLKPFKPGGSLVTEDAGLPAAEALKNDSSLRPAYNEYYGRAAPIAAGRPGRLPLIGKPLARWRIGLHDLAPRNIGYTPGRGFVAFDPSVDGNFSGFFGTIGFYGEPANAFQGLRLLHPPLREGADAGAPK